MIECSLQEYNRATNQNWAEKHIMEAGRTQTIQWTVLGRKVAECVKTYLRGKATTFYYCAKEFKYG
jgi:hypothetical protein